MSASLQTPVRPFPYGDRVVVECCAKDLVVRSCGSVSGAQPEAHTGPWAIADPERERVGHPRYGRGLKAMRPDMESFATSDILAH